MDDGLQTNRPKGVLIDPPLFFHTPKPKRNPQRPHRRVGAMAQGKTQKKDGTLRIKGADGQPVEIPAGRWYQNPKARPERLMLNAALSADGRRVLDCLELHSIAYGQEACIKQEAGKKRRDLTPADVATETELPKQRVRRALVELEEAGAAERRAVDGGNLRNGKVRLVCFAEPREIRPAAAGETRARLLWPDWFPQGCEPLKAYITQQKITLLDNIDAVFEGDARDYFIAELEEAARSYFEAAEVVARKLERVRARSNGRRLQLGRKTNTERQTSSSSPAPSDPEVPTPEEEEEISTSTKNQNQAQHEPAETAPPPNPQLAPPDATQAAGNGADGPAFDELRDRYPKERTDEGKARNQWKALSAAERQKAVDGLSAFLDCERWKRTPQYIPFLSNWLKNAEYRHAPPPFFEPRGKNGPRWGPSPEEADRIINEALEAERKAKAERRKP